MAVDFTFDNIVNIISQEMFGGNTTVGSLAVMMAVTFIMMAILANFKAPVQYSLVPTIIMAITFTSMGMMDASVSFVIIIISAVIVASNARKIIGG